MLSATLWSWVIGQCLPYESLCALAQTQTYFFTLCAKIVKLQTQLVCACRYGRVDTVKRLVAHPYINPGLRDQLPLYAAATKGQVHVVHFLLQQPGVDPTYRKESKRPAVFVAAVSHRKGAVVRRLLLDRRVDPTVMGNTAIAVAKDQPIIDLLLVDPRVWLAQCVARQRGRTESYSAGVYL